MQPNALKKELQPNDDSFESIHEARKSHAGSLFRCEEDLGYW